MRVITAALIASAAATTAFIAAPVASASVVQCGSANGYSVSAESSTTSCGFALVVARAVPSGFSGENFRTNATSPATGQSYQVQCGRLYQRTIECTTYTGARVYLNS